MAYQLSKLVTDVRNRLDDSTFDSSLIKQFINDAQRELFNNKLLRATETTFSGTVSAGTYIYALPSAFSSVLSFRITDPDGNVDDLTDRYLDIKEFDRRFTHPEMHAQGTPRHWTIYGDNYHLYPIPDATYTIDMRYYKTPTELSADSDVPEVPEAWQEVLTLGALRRAHEFNDDYDLAQVIQVKIDDLTVDMSRRDASRKVAPVIMNINRTGTRGI